MSTYFTHNTESDHNSIQVEGYRMEMLSSMAFGGRGGGGGAKLKTVYDTGII